MEDFDILCLKVLFLLSTPLRVSIQGISSSVSFSLTIVELEVITREFLGPADLFEAQTLCVYKLSEIVIIGKHKDFILRAL